MASEELMKNLLLLILSTLLISFSASADLQVKRAGTEYAFSFVENGVQHCWVMPEWVDLNYFDYTWRTVPNTALIHNWPIPEQTVSCDAVIPRTLAGSLYFIIPAMPIPIPAGIPCGDPVSYTFNGYALRSVTYNRVTGYALCR
jgi:hypothetical protein